MQKVKSRIEGQVAVVTLNDPATLNAAGVDLVAELSHVLQGHAAEGAGVRAVVVTGEGRGFCSGANLGGGMAAEVKSGVHDPSDVLTTVYNPLIALLRDYPLPMVMAVNGAAAGVGCSIALMGDIVVAGESGYFLQAFRRIGLVPDGGASYLLPRLIGKARAMEMALLGEKIPAQTALEWGLINRCVPDEALMETALELARALASGPKAVGMIRRLIWDGLDAGSLVEQLHRERTVQGQAGKTEDFREGVAAFLEKRPAAFKGR